METIGSNNETMLDAALGYAGRGLFVFPLHGVRADGACTCGRHDCGSVGKHPRTPNGLKDATTDPGQIRDWWTRWPDANVGIRTGAESGIVVLDVDAKNGGLDSLDALLYEHGPLPRTPGTLTGGGGRHILFRHPGHEVRNSASKLRPGLDIRGDGGYVVVPPSIHASGARYRWDERLGLDEVDPAPWPAWLPALMQATRKGEPAPGREPGWGDDEGRPVCEGQRNQWLTSEAGAMRRRGHAEDEMLEQLLILNEARCRPPLDAAEVRGIARSVCQYAPADGGQYKLTDLGNAERFIDRHGADVRHCRAFGRWLVWQGTHWEVDEQGQAEYLAQQTVRSIWDEIPLAQSIDERSDLARHARWSESARAITSMLKLAESRPGVPIRPEQLDTDPWLLSVLNGTLDLRTGTLREHRRGDYITKCVQVEYDPEAACTRWEQFLGEIMQHDEERISFLRRAIGYTLTGDTRERCLFILHGVGRNGKSTLLQVLDELLGGYAVKTPVTTLLVKRGDSIPNDVARLKGARFVYASEADEGKRLAEATIKELTGREKVSARFMRAEWFDFIPEFKLWLGTNHKPVIQGTDKAIWDRIRLVPFEARFEGQAEDPDLRAKLQAELPGILAWAVRGCLEWQEQGLGMPAKIRAAINEYKAAMDAIGCFLREQFEWTDQDEDWIGSAELYSMYKTWCWGSEEEPLPMKSFVQRIKERGIRERRTSKARGWCGLRLIGGGFGHQAA